MCNIKCSNKISFVFVEKCNTFVFIQIKYFQFIIQQPQVFFCHFYLQNVELLFNPCKPRIIKIKHVIPHPLSIAFQIRNTLHTFGPRNRKQGADRLNEKNLNPSRTSVPEKKPFHTVPKSRYRQGQTAARWDNSRAKVVVARASLARGHSSLSLGTRPFSEHDQLN